MTHQEIDKVIRQAIETMQTVELKINYGLGDSVIEIDLDPYIFGADIMQYDFVWGFIPSQHLYFRLMYNSIVSAKLTNKKFIVQNDALYLYAMEEEHWSRAKGFDNSDGKIYAEGLVKRTTE